MTRLILASRSPARLKMLQDAGLPVEARRSPMDEATAKAALIAAGLDPCGLATALARHKAAALHAGADAVVLGADQTLALEGELLDKPGDLETLRSQLQRLQGRSHRLHAAAVLMRNGEILWEGVSTATLSMRTMTPVELDRYIGVEGPQVLECVGGYRLEGPGVQLFEAVEGEYFAVLGLPLLGLLAALRVLGVGL